MNLTEYKALTKIVKPRAKRQYPEYEEQKKLVVWWYGLKTTKKIPQHYHLICTDTSAKRTKMQQGRYKAMGGRAGVLDLFIAVPDGDHCGLWIEMKAPGRHKEKDGALSKEQIKFKDDMECLCYKVAVCYSAKEAQEEIMSYLRLKLR